MKCEACGYESETSFNFCPGCGTAIQNTEMTQNPAANVILCALKDKMLLVICILLSVSCLLSLAADSLPLLGILAAVFLWITYAKSRKDIADAEQLRCVSGTVYAQYVITNVVSVILMVVGVICFAAFDAIAGQSAIWEAIAEELGTDILPVTELTGSIFAGVFSSVFVLIGALMLVLNIFSMRYIHRFAKSLYQSIQKGTLELKHTTAAYVWLFVFAGFIALSALASGDFMLLLANGVNCALYIIAGLLIRKYFADK